MPPPPPPVPPVPPPAPEAFFEDFVPDFLAELPVPPVPPPPVLPDFWLAFWEPLPEVVVEVSFVFVQEVTNAMPTIAMMDETRDFFIGCGFG